MTKVETAITYVAATIVVAAVACALVGLILITF